MRRRRTLGKRGLSVQLERAIHNLVGHETLALGEGQPFLSDGAGFGHCRVLRCRVEAHALGREAQLKTSDATWKHLRQMFRPARLLRRGAADLTGSALSR